MSRPLTRRIAASVAAAALVAGGVAVGTGTAFAAGTGSTGSAGSSDAAPGPDLNNNGVVPEAGQSYPSAVTRAVDNIEFTRQVLDGGTVAPGGQVTYRTTFSVTTGLDRFLNKVVDIPPSPGFTYVAGSAKVGGKSVDTAVDAVNGAVKMTDSGWRLSKNTGDTVVFEVTYKAPANLVVGNVYNSGVSFHPTTWTTDQNFPNVNAWVKARSANPGEAITGSIDDAGLGSSGSAGSAIITDPAGFIAQIISKVVKNGS